MLQPDYEALASQNNMTQLMEAAALLTDTPLKEIRDFIDQVVAETDSIPDRLADDEPIIIRLNLTLTIDDQAWKYFKRELKRAKRRVRM
jgi:hypothetical protein